MSFLLLQPTLILISNKDIFFAASDLPMVERSFYLTVFCLRCFFFFNFFHLKYFSFCIWDVFVVHLFGLLHWFVRWLAWHCCCYLVLLTITLLLMLCAASIATATYLFICCYSCYCITTTYWRCVALWSGMVWFSVAWLLLSWFVHSFVYSCQFGHSAFTPESIREAMSSSCTWLQLALIIACAVLISLVTYFQIFNNYL